MLDMNVRFGQACAHGWRSIPLRLSLARMNIHTVSRHHQPTETRKVKFQPDN